MPAEIGAGAIVVGMQGEPFAESAQVYDLLYRAAGKDFAVEADELDRVIQAHRPGSRSLLDVACGTGAHLQHLVGRYEVAGVDISAGMLAQASRRLPDVPFVRADMRSFDLGRRFDAVVCLFSSIGYLESADDLATAVGTMARHLVDGGVLVVDGWVRPEAWRPPGVVQALSGHEGGVAAARVARSRREGDRTVLELHHLVGTVDGVEHVVEVHELTMFTEDDHRAAFDRAGLTVEVHPSPYPDRDRYVGVKR